MKLEAYDFAALCPSIKMSRCFFFHFLARRVGPYRVCVTSKNKIADQGSGVTSHGTKLSFGDPHFLTPKILRFMVWDSFL